MGGIYWANGATGLVVLATLSFFHVTGMIHSFLAPIAMGGTAIYLTRWDRTAALDAIEKYKVVLWAKITTMLIDLLVAPDINQRDISSLGFVGGGGGMPHWVHGRGRLFLHHEPGKTHDQCCWQERIANAREQGMASLVAGTFANWFTPEFLSTGDPIIKKNSVTIQLDSRSAPKVLHFKNLGNQGWLLLNCRDSQARTPWMDSCVS
jgi:acyl-CoA synthetase (AMP-forming)/AMP-acid ligase II